MPSSDRIIDGAFLASLEALALYMRTTLTGRLGGAHRSRAYGSSTEFVDHRAYMPGDDLRRLDWNLVARLDKYYIKQFVAERQHRTHVYLDTSASMCADARKARLALQLAAAVGFLSVQSLDHVAYRLLGGGQCRDLCGTITGRDSFFRAARQLESVAFTGETDLGTSLRTDPAPGFDDGLSIIISDFFCDSDWQGAVDRLISRRREVILIRLISPQESDPQYSGPLALADAEASPTAAPMQLQIDRSALLAYRQALECFESRICAFCAARGILLIQARSDEPPEHIILKKGLVA